MVYFKNVNIGNKKSTQWDPLNKTTIKHNFKIRIFLHDPYEFKM